MSFESDLARLLRSGERLVLATIISRSGSAPRRPGARLAVTRDLTVLGSVGGGLAEAETLACTGAVRESGRGRVLRFEMQGDLPGSDMICGGSVDVLVENLRPDQAPLFERADHCRGTGGFGVWTVNLRDPANPVRVFHADPAGLSSPVLEQTRCNAAAVIRENGLEVYVEPLLHDGILLLCGGGHVSLATAALSPSLGFELEVADDRPEFASASRFPQARRVHVLPAFEGLAEACAIGPEHYVVIVTRGHQFDRQVLLQILRTPARYIGMIGSRKKRDAVYAMLRQEGLGDADFKRVHCPVGLDIGAETPGELAVAIAGELVAARHGRLG